MTFPWRMKIRNAADQVVDICIFKRIGNYEGCYSITDMASALAEVSQITNKCRLLLHTPGGDPIEGLPVYRMLRDSGLKVTEVVVVGMAASLGFVFLQFPGAHRVMCEYTRAMCHKVKGWAEGDLDDIENLTKQMKEMEDDLINIIANRAKLTPEVVRSNWFDGKDHWFTPEEALAAGLIDEVRKGKIPVAPLMENAAPDDLFGFYNEFLVEEKHTTKVIDKKMKFTNEFIAKYGLPAEADSITVENLINAQFKSKDDKIVEITNELNTLKAEKTAARKVEFEALLNSDKKKFSPEQKTNFQGLYEKDPEVCIKTMNLMPDFKSIAAIPENDGSNPVIPEQFKGKTFNQLQASSEGGRFLEKIKANNFEVYAELYKAEFGKEPQK